MKKSDRDLSILGFGCMRLPVLENGTVSLRLSKEMIRYAIDHGVNYLDTAWPYHNGESETVVGKSLQDGYREKVNLATKLPTWLIEKQKDMDKYLDMQMKKLQTDHIDYYLIHALSRDRLDHMEKLGMADFLDDALADGRIKYAGFSYHETPDVFKSCVDAYDWTFCQIQYNYLDEDYQAGTAGMKYAASKGLGVVVMEPLRGGALTKPVPAIDRLWAGSGIKRSLAEWGLRWVWNHPEVTVVLSGMTTLEQVKEDLKYAESSGMPGIIKPDEMKVYDRVKAAYRERIKVGCTGCGYCMPCNNGVNIPGCFEQYNNAIMFEDAEEPKKVYNMFMSDGCASKCIDCGECEEKCPQQIPIREKLKEVVELFGK
jgi:Predicted oxidoreductases of the aldo/keto reductase family